MAKSKTSEARRQILDLLAKSGRAVVGVEEIAAHVKLPKAQVLTILGQLKGEVECVSRATMHESASMKWHDVDSKWRLAKPQAPPSFAQVVG